MSGDRLDDLLAEMRADTAPLGDGLRARVLADAADAARTARPERPWRVNWGALLAAACVPATALGLVIGLTLPATVLEAVPGAAPVETALLDEVFGDWGEIE